MELSEYSGDKLLLLVLLLVVAFTAPVEQLGTCISQIALAVNSVLSEASGMKQVPSHDFLKVFQRYWDKVDLQITASAASTQEGGCLVLCQDSDCVKIVNNF